MFLPPHQQRQSPDLPSSPPVVSHQLKVSDRLPAPTKANPPRTIEGNNFPTFTNPYQRPQTLGNFKVLFTCIERGQANGNFNILCFFSQNFIDKILTLSQLLFALRIHAISERAIKLYEVL